MSKSYKTEELYLQEMRDACVKIQEYVSKVTEEDFLQRRESFDAVCMQFAHMGEQVRLMESSKDRVIHHFPDEVDWPAVKALRNRIDHAYATVDAQMIWDFAIKDVQDIRDGVSRILKKRFGK